MLKDRLLYGKNYCSVEHAIDVDGNAVYYVLILSKKKEELLVKSKEVFGGFEEVVNFLKQENQQHIVVVINNQQVLAKETENKDGSGIHRAFPTLSLNDFNSEEHVTATTTFVAIVRKEYLASIQQSYKDAGIGVLDVSLGNHAIFSLEEVLPKNEELYTSNAKIKMANTGIATIRPGVFTDYRYTINGLVVENTQVLNLGAIVQCYLNKVFKQGNQNADEYFQKRLFTSGYKVLLLVVFATLLVNFLFFSNYFSKVERLTSYLGVYGDQKQELQKLTESVAAKKKLLEEIQGTTGKSTARYIDELVAQFPETMVLNEVNFQPFIGAIKEGKKITNEIDLIQVSGNFKNNEELSSWIDVLEKKNWVREIRNLTIEREAKKNDAMFYFSIQLKE